MPTFWDSSIRFDLLMSETIGELKMSRLSEKMKAAAAVGPRQAAKLEARADRIIAMDAVIDRKADESFGAHEQLLAEAESGLADVLHALAGATNGAPLEPSSDSPAAPAVAGEHATTFPEVPSVREG